MPTRQKRNLGVVIATLAVLGAVLGSVSVRRYHERALQRLAEQLSQTQAQSARGALADRLTLLEAQANSAAQLPQIRGQVLAFDAATLRDSFRTETWWEPFRADFSVYGLAVDKEALEVLEGMQVQDLDVAPLIRSAREHRRASALLKAGPKGWPYAAAASVVDVPGRALQPVLVLLRGLDQGFAQELALKIGAPVALSDGKGLLLAAGAEQGAAVLKGLIGREGERSVIAADGSSGAAAVDLLPGVWLWTLSSVGAQGAEFARDEQTGRIIIWGLALLVAVAALFFGLRGEPAGPSRGATGPTGEIPGSAGSTPVAGTSRAATGSSGPAHPIAEDAEATALHKAPPKPDRANVFGRYVLLDRLGEGGMAEVYTAVSYGAENFRRNFVVKRLRPEMARNPDVVSAFIDEANLASSLVHSNIVPVFDFGKVGDEYFLAQEYILGRDLGRVNRRALERDGKPLPLAQVFYVAHETLEALDYAHTRTGEGGKPLGLVHRDVSPNNILVSARAEVKLFDFGIAKADGRITQTQSGMVKGNVRFMSPEQARGEAVDSRSDLFAIGLVLYYALSGDALYAADTAYNLLVKAAQGPGQKELASLSALPKEARRVLERALQPDVAARFQTAAEFAQALAPFIAGAHDGLARSMERLFAEDIRAEEARFATAAAQGSPTQAAGTQRFARPGKP